jgi:hypothetical protein
VTARTAQHGIAGMTRTVVLLYVAAVLIGCAPGKESDEKPARTVTTPRRQPATPVTQDPADFPKMASHLAFGSGGAALNARFALNVIRACDASVAARSYAINPRQVNFLVVGMTRPPSPGCGNEWGFAVTYGAGYHQHSRPLVSRFTRIGTIRPFDSAACRDVAC